MNKRVLVFGGTRFFGKKLVQRLLDDGYAVTIATRGTVADLFGERVTHITLDRERPESIVTAVGNQTWDVVYDNICYSPDEAQAACDIFVGKVGRYIFTSSMSVYEQGERVLNEADFDPYSLPLQYGPKTAFTYADGKRLAEAVLFQKASFPVCAVRIPIVHGRDDYTRRLHFHVEHVRNGQAIGMPNPSAAMSFITANEAAGFLAWLAEQTLEGPVNASSHGVLRLDAIVATIEQAVDRRARIVTTGDASADKVDMSPFGVERSWMLDNTRASNAGYAFSDVMDWYPQLIREIAAEIESGEVSA